MTPAEEAARRGRPEIGPTVQLRFPEQTLQEVDRLAGDRDVTRSEMVRLLVDVGLRHPDRLPGRPIADDTSFSDELRQRMVAARIRGPRDLASLVGVNQSTATRWLLGQSVPGEDMRAKIAAALSVGAVLDPKRSYNG